jgi:uncharacterized repeat protein (TIGR03803 family)
MTSVGFSRPFNAVLFFAAVSVAAVQPAQAQTYTVLHSFAGPPNDGAFANAELIQDTAGNFYGTTNQGGTDDGGTIFKLDQTGVVTILHSFIGNDGAFPDGGLLRDAEGNFYGVTSTGGPAGLGTVFKLDTSNTLKTLHSFIGNLNGAGDGDAPRSRLVTLSGDLYGITTLGGGSANCKGGCGTIYKMTKGGTETVLYRFTGGADGANPQGIIRDSAGNLYGVASSGGAGAGTVWKLDTAGVFSTLYSFTGGADGGTPMGRLIRDSRNGALRGVAASGGDPTCNCGVVYSLDTSGNERVIHKFFGRGGGAGPLVGLLDLGGVLYGTTASGGDLTCSPPGGCGALYRIGRTGQYTVLHKFAGPAGADGAYEPFGGLMLGADGSIYGATWYGGTGTGCEGPFPGCGVIFKYTP